MIILTIRTDREEAEIGLYNDHEKLSEIQWHAHRTLAATIHRKIEELLNKPAPLQNLSGAVGNRIVERQDFGAGLSISVKDIGGIVCFKGPGSFTGLRIGLSVANALAYANQIPIVARQNEDWLEAGIDDLLAGKNDKIATPFYDRPAVHRTVHGPAATSKPRK